mgnify:CR=1 FL=1
MRRPAILCALFAAFSVPALAETIGTITATVDGQEKTWYVTAADGESQSSWVQPMPGMLSMSSFSLWGNPSEEEIASVKDVLAIGFTVVRGRGGMTPANPEVQYLVTGFDDQWVATGEGATDLTISELERAGEGVRVAGSFTAHAHYTSDGARLELDRSRGKTISGSFQATLPAP